VDKYDQNGVFQGRLVSQGPLNSPWGLALAPAGFGPFSGDLLVGNFGDGTINVFDTTTDTQVGTIRDGLGNPIVIDGLWGLQFGNGGSGGATGALYFTAGPNGESGGVLGVLFVPEPGTLGLLLVGTMMLAKRRRG
jgi:uncharacterized protein (TIGR03118 family)